MENTVGANAKIAVPKKSATNANTYVAKNQYEVVIRGNSLVARMYRRGDGTQILAIAQGMPREETLQKLLLDCPEFCKQNGITSATNPTLF